jgi:glycosyltransferase involved in cell wall biosynthesis
MANQSDVWVVVPAFNEARTIGQVLADLAQQGFHTVVVDDGSTDPTGASALAFPVTLLRHAVNLGQGAALQTGIRFALSRPDVKFIATCDADGQHQAADLVRMVSVCREGAYDVVLGSRFLEGGAAPGLDLPKRLALKLAILFTRVATGLALSDTHNGLRVMTATTAGRIRLTQNGMAHASEILSQIARLRLRFCEVPVAVRYTSYSRAKGQSVWNSVNIVVELLEGFLR